MSERLTPKEWEDSRKYWEIMEASTGATGEPIVPPNARFRQAATAMRDQPFGFTREDVAALEECYRSSNRDALAMLADDRKNVYAKALLDAGRRTRHVAERLAALLPPGEPDADA
jgi:hypothetical protein